MPLERLQKILAQAGIASRRAAESYIVAGRVRVNGKVVSELGAKADPRGDKIEVDGKRIVAELPVYIVLHKPRGVVSTLSDPEGRPTVRDLVAGVGARVFPVGRLDFHTSGVLLLTNDGEFSDGLLHPKRDVPKAYIVKVNGEMKERDMKLWEEGVELEDGKTRPAHVHFLRNEAGKSWLEVTLFEGKNQQIRRMGEATGFRVMRLARQSFAGIEAERLHPGQWRDLTTEELTALRADYGVPKRIPAPRPPVPRAKPVQRGAGAAAQPRTAAPVRGGHEHAEPRGPAHREAPGRGRPEHAEPRGPAHREAPGRGRPGRPGQTRPTPRPRGLTPGAPARTRKPGG